MAQIYFDEEDIFSAKHTLQSVLSNYDNETDGIKDEAEEKLSAIFEAEETARQEEEILKLKINLVEEDSDGGLFPDEDFEIEMPEDEFPQEENKAPVIEIKDDSEEKTNE